MTNVVVDIGNSRVKFCQTVFDDLLLPVRGIGRDSAITFDDVARDWDLTAGTHWAVASTDPARLAEFLQWAKDRGDQTFAVESPWQIPMGVQVDFPEKVGIDRLLNAYAAKKLIKLGEPAIIVDSGSAVTVDLLDEAGFFQGGSIFPGLNLMAKSLHAYTAKLPLVDPREGTGILPGKNTESAMRLGIMNAVAGGIDAIVRELATQCLQTPRVFLTGGDMTPALSGLLQSRHQFLSEVRPALTLEGIRLVAEYHS
ncbi:type III pantothenate kinase [Zavarzinella formosa]|uniref:type III pantothenate kinase n=1 Tax=Zavarzinella formosa TaxID=360055 RepID=UPI0002ECED39|nr:type III pantothenate kinase [Zavarzinella formosa]